MAGCRAVLHKGCYLIPAGEGDASLAYICFHIRARGKRNATEVRRIMQETVNWSAAKGVDAVEAIASARLFNLANALIIGPSRPTGSPDKPGKPEPSGRR